MKRFLIYFCSLIAIVVSVMLLADALNILMMFKSTGSAAYKVMRLFRGYPQDEIPILGSSRAHLGFVPSEIDKRAFNYGLSGSGFNETVMHLHQILRRKRCKLVIVNLDPWGFTNQPLRGDYRFVLDADTLSIPFFPKGKMVDKIPGIRFQGELRGHVVDFINNVSRTEKYVEDGALLMRTVRTDDEWEHILKKENGGRTCRFRCDSQVKESLREALVKNEHTAIVFVVSPIACEWWNVYSGKDDFKEVKEWLGQFPNVTLLDCEDVFLGYDLRNFHDLTHLNENGARRFSKQLRNALMKWQLL